jgi:ADP-ribose pyrophosphatase
MSQDPIPDFTEELLATRLVYDGRLLKLREDSVRLCDGSHARREYVEHPGAVIIIALIDDDTLLLERQFRYPLRRHLYELPAGKIEPGEAPLRTAQRELVEECGYQAREWQHLATLHPCAAYSDEHVELYLARDLTYVGPAREVGEFLEVLPVKIVDLPGWVASGKVTDIKVVASLVWLNNLLTS